MKDFFKTKIIIYICIISVAIALTSTTVLVITHFLGKNNNPQLEYQSDIADIFDDQPSLLEKENKEKRIEFNKNSFINYISQKNPESFKKVTIIDIKNQKLDTQYQDNIPKIIKSSEEHYNSTPEQIHPSSIKQEATSTKESPEESIVSDGVTGILSRT